LLHNINLLKDPARFVLVNSPPALPYDDKEFKNRYILLPTIKDSVAKMKF
jgi:hypothetical protein